MLAGLRQVLASPMTSALALAVAVALATALGLSGAAWQDERADYQQRIADLTRAADRAQTTLQTQLATCQARQEAREALEMEFAARPTIGSDPARRLLQTQPEGIDACARMESADRAVLANLKN
jgi:uncharacterized protein HemX